MSDEDAPVTGTALVAHPGAELYGSDRMTLETVEGLAERGWRVVLAVPNDGPLVAEAQRLGADTVLVDAPVLRKSLLKPAALVGLLRDGLAARREIDALLRDVRPDVVYVATVTIPLWVQRARRHRVPVVVHVHESERRAARLLRLALARPLRLADRVLLNSRHSRDALLEVDPELAARSRVVLNGVAAPRRVVEPRAALDGPVRLVYVGRMSPRKGVDVAIEALGLLTADGLDATLDVVGGVFSGYEWFLHDLRERVAALGLEQRVSFRGFHPEVWTALSRADIALVPSREEEPFGNTAVEAVLAGRPVAVSAIGGLAEAIDGFASAIPVAPGDPAALAEGIRRIVADWPAIRAAALADAPQAAARHRPERYREQVVQALESVARTPRREAVGAR